MSVRDTYYEEPIDTAAEMWEAIGEFVYEFADKNAWRYHRCTPTEIKLAFDDMVNSDDTPLQAALDAVLRWGMGEGRRTQKEDEALQKALEEEKEDDDLSHR